MPVSLPKRRCSWRRPSASAALHGGGERRRRARRLAGQRGPALPGGMAPHYRRQGAPLLERQPPARRPRLANRPANGIHRPGIEALQGEEPVQLAAAVGPLRGQLQAGRPRGPPAPRNQRHLRRRNAQGQLPGEGLGKNAVLDSKEIDIPACVHDVVGALYHLRTLRMDPGESVTCRSATARRASTRASKRSSAKRSRRPAALTRPSATRRSCSTTCSSGATRTCTSG